MGKRSTEHLNWNPPNPKILVTPLQYSQYLALPILSKLVPSCHKTRQKIAPLHMTLVENRAPPSPNPVSAPGQREFRAWFETITPSRFPEPWFHRAIEEEFRCALFPDSRPRYDGRMCTGRELISSWGPFGRWEEAGLMGEKLLFALDAAYRTVCEPPLQGLCQRFRREAPAKIARILAGMRQSLRVGEVATESTWRNSRKQDFVAFTNLGLPSVVGSAAVHSSLFVCFYSKRSASSVLAPHDR